VVLSNSGTVYNLLLLPKRCFKLFEIFVLFWNGF